VAAATTVIVLLTIRARDFHGAGAVEGEVLPAEVALA
jgi:hypothetical protein